MAGPSPLLSHLIGSRAIPALAAVWKMRWSVIVLVLAGCAGPRATGPAVRAESPAPEPLPYTRVSRPNADTYALEIAIRKFVPASGRGPVVWLSGVSHIGETNYYAQLQRHLDTQNLVLYEGVGARDKKLRFDPAEESSLQHTLATSLGLMFQLSAIDYNRPHFENSDLTIAELQRMMLGQDSAGSDENEAGTGAKGAVESEELRALMGVMDGSSVLGMLVHVGVKLIGSSPKLQAIAKLAMIETLGRFQGDLSDAKGIPPEMQRLMTVIIRGRNDVVLRDLRKHIPNVKAGRTISVFYGAGHMADLERRLVAEMGYRRQSETWLTALAVDARRSGLSQAELQMVQGLVQWQIDTMQGRR